MKGIPMQTGVLCVLSAIAASWRRHKKPRRTGQTRQAQRRERETVLRDLGWITVSTFAPIERFPLATLAVARGTPFIDIRPVTDVIVFAHLPRVTRDGSVHPEPWGPEYISRTLMTQEGKRSIELEYIQPGKQL
ncbi:hypothetical protein [Thalassobacter stenotrophicus]|uniref:hypothetical protein n=1 Tax=Thalassobacter stenotrophicus TaxID=266809 RepID=UPI000D5CEC3E|nr:hypothetical protein [Thalassobacter stenotrophicus]PVZ45950.1 hypothetical protein DD557_16990 [Thalassobacter stenotrophicus]